MTHISLANQPSNHSTVIIHWHREFSMIDSEKTGSMGSEIDWFHIVTIYKYLSSFVCWNKKWEILILLTNCHLTSSDSTQWKTWANFYSACLLVVKPCTFVPLYMRWICLRSSNVIHIYFLDIIKGIPSRALLINGELKSLRQKKKRKNETQHGILKDYLIDVMQLCKSRWILIGLFALSNAHSISV